MTTRDVWFRLLRLTAPLGRRLLIASALAAGTVMASVALLATSAWLISAAALQPSIAELNVAVVSVRFFGIARGLSRYAERYTGHRLSFDLISRLRTSFYAAVQARSTSSLVGIHTADLFSRAVADVNTLELLYAQSLSHVLASVLVSAALLVGFIHFAPVLGLAWLIFAALAAVGLPWFAWQRGKYNRHDQRHAQTEFNTALADHLQGLADILAFRAQHSRVENLARLSQRLLNRDRQVARTNALLAALQTALGGTAALVILVIGLQTVAPIYLASLMLAATAAFEVFAPLVSLGQQGSEQTDAARRLFTLMDLPDAPAFAPTSAKPVGMQLDVENIHVRHEGSEQPAINSLSFSLPEGKTIAIVGPSGSGKSTLINLLLRFHEPQSGAVRLGGVDLAQLEPEDVRALCAVVPQRIYLFNTSIAENIRIARPDAGDAEVQLAARAARLHAFVMSLPDGYSTVVGENGAKLSAGERQRIGIARALLRGAPIMLLDEPTAHLDSLTEQAVMGSLLKARPGQTTLLATHRLALASSADEIIVLHQGREVERGTHARLLANSEGFYRYLWDAQHDPLRVL